MLVYINPGVKATGGSNEQKKSSKLEDVKRQTFDFQLFLLLEYSKQLKIGRCVSRRECNDLNGLFEGQP